MLDLSEIVLEATLFSKLYLSNQVWQIFMGNKFENSFWGLEFGFFFLF